MSSSTTPKSALIIGGGIVGLSTAYALCREGISVVVIDPGDPLARATSATAGIIGGSSVIPWASAALWPRLPALLLEKDGPLRMKTPLPRGLAGFFRQSVRAGRPDARKVSSAGLAGLGLRGWDAWQDLLGDLPDARAFFVQNGCLFYYADEAQVAADAAANTLRRGFGMDLTDLSAGDMQDILPPLSRPVAGGVRVNAAGHVTDPLGLQAHLKAAVQAHGGVFVDEAATGLMVDGALITGVKTANGDYEADAIVIAAGAGAAPLMANLGRKIPMIPGWGASVTFTDPEIDLDTPFLMLSDGVAVTPSLKGLRVSGLLKVGGAGKADAMNATLIGHAKRLFGDFGYGELIAFTGPRPLTADSLPLLGPDPSYKNLYHNYGHGHWGLTQASISAQVTADLVTGRDPRIDISAYRPARF